MNKGFNMVILKAYESLAFRIAAVLFILTAG